MACIMGVPQPEDQSALIVSTCVCATGVLPVRGLTGCRMLHPIVAEATLVWPGPGLLSTFLGQGSYSSRPSIFTWPWPPLAHPPGGCMPCFLPQAEQEESQRRKSLSHRPFCTLLLSTPSTCGRGLFPWALSWCGFWILFDRLSALSLARLRSLNWF